MPDDQITIIGDGSGARNEVGTQVKMGTTADLVLVEWEDRSYARKLVTG